ncbi:type II toxin-antitoxin system death-on-curing family toxin [Wenzhouxiangella sediminis]|uniref:Type II toxin-antitoxin system death-on-curing family toxin n=1 Tax=Wenzhouxiangella sediminis TaxID=1792836 RepID=A0A3E1K6T0_9GAMM|nr:type II toxin-antitoxin system death-on-curing family toxin [Wenzhouxiangella sediminis]RFF29384.1 type II toxin-antitoxin system death-on-curing family toxin [Wenzhouxiangella sediminis]
MTDPIWLSSDLIEAVHERQLIEHGGGTGVRDRGMLESALARPQQLYAYGEDVDVVALAASYAFGLSRNHPFVDGNKRTAAVACELFLELNGHQLLAEDSELYPVFMALAAGEMEEEGLLEWLRHHARPNQVSEAPGRYA